MKTKLVLVLAVTLVATAYAGEPAKSDFFKTSDGVRIHYLDAGQGRPIVFIPGWTMPAWIWEKQIEAFSKNYRVIAVDPRSQGESDRPHSGDTPETRSRDYKELVDHLGLKQPVLVGWSMACGELLSYAAQFGSDNVSGYALVDGYLFEKPDPAVFTAMSGWMVGLQADRENQVNGFVRSMYKKPQSEEYLKRVIDAAKSVPTETAVVLIYNMIATRDLSAGFTKMSRPVLFAYGPQAQPVSELLKAKFGDKVRLEKFEGEGHALFVDNPEKFNRVLESFVKSLPSQ